MPINVDSEQDGADQHDGEGKKIGEGDQIRAGGADSVAINMEDVKEKEETADGD